VAHFESGEHMYEKRGQTVKGWVVFKVDGSRKTRQGTTIFPTQKLADRWAASANKSKGQG
jgi:hypothetical protein